MAQWWGVALALLMLHAPLHTSADWTLVVAHSNDLWYQLDEIQGDNTPCYEDLPPLTTQPPTTTTTVPPETTTTTTPTTPTPTTPSTTTPTTPTTTTTTPTTPTTTTNAPTTTTPTTTTETTTTTVTSPASTSATGSPAVSMITGKATLLKELALEAGQKRSARSISDFESPKASRQCYGGVPRHLTKVTELKTESESNGKVFLHLNAGGMLGGYIWYPILGAGPAVESIKTLNYNAVALGYRDFEDGVPETVKYLQALKDAGVTVLCANMDISGEPSMSNLYKKSMVINIDSVRKIGIIGYIGQDADYMADTGKIKFTDPVAAIEAEITSLYNQQVYFVIALGSAGFENAKLWMDRAYNVDLFVNGGSNTFLYNDAAVGPLNENIAGRYPIESYSQGSKRLFVQTSRYGKYLGKIEMNINDEGRINSYGATNPFLLDSSVTKNPDLQYKVDQWEREVLTQANEIIGYTKIPIISDRKICWYTECTGGALMADAARAFLEKNTTAGNGWSETVAATVWHGGALSDTDLDIGAGPITFGDILTMFPYANVVVRALMYGQQIITLFEESVSYYNDTTTPNRGEFLHVSGMRVEYDLSKPSGSRVASIYIRDTNNPQGGMAPIVNNQVYRIGMPSFIANGGSRFSSMEDFALKNSTGQSTSFVIQQ